MYLVVGLLVVGVNLVTHQSYFLIFGGLLLIAALVRLVWPQVNDASG